MVQVTAQQSPHNEWEELEAHLGPPEHNQAQRRAAELKADGWEFMGVVFKNGRWWFRRPRERLES